MSATASPIERGAGLMADPTMPLDALRKLRTTHRGRDTDAFDRLYRAYVTTLVGLFGFYMSLGLVDDLTVSPDDIEWVRTSGPSWIGLAAAATILSGLRTGRAGGPLALDEFEAHHILLSPLPRRAAFRDPLRRLALTVAAATAIVGAALGELAARQLPGGQLEWVLSGMLSGLALGSLWLAGALLVHGSPTHQRVALAIGSALVAWSIADLAAGMTTAPTSLVGSLALRPLSDSTVGFVAVALGVVLAAVGSTRAAKMSVERLVARARLVRQVRFALAQQDIRTLMLLRRQLSLESPRRSPWMATHRLTALDRRAPVIARALRSYLRWPRARVLQVVAQASLAGVAARGLWHGSLGFVAVMGVVAYVTALDVIEPLAQDLDHPGLLELVPVRRGPVHLSLLVGATAVMWIWWLLASLVAGLLSFDPDLALAMLIASVSASSAATVAAALSIKRLDAATLIPNPETDGPRLLIRLLWPPALATVGALPVLASSRAALDGGEVVASAVNTLSLVLVPIGLAWAWVRVRDSLPDLAAQQEARTS